MRGIDPLHTYTQYPVYRTLPTLHTEAAGHGGGGAADGGGGGDGGGYGSGGDGGGDEKKAAGKGGGYGGSGNGGGDGTYEKRGQRRGSDGAHTAEAHKLRDGADTQ